MSLTERIFGGVMILISVAAWWSHRELQATRADLVEAESRIAGYEELVRFNARAKAADVEWSKAEKDLGESDAPLSDYMSGVASRVWP